MTFLGVAVKAKKLIFDKLLGGDEESGIQAPKQKITSPLRATQTIKTSGKKKKASAGKTSLTDGEKPVRKKKQPKKKKAVNQISWSLTRGPLCV